MFKTASEDLISFNSYGSVKKRKSSKNDRNRSFLSSNMAIYGKYAFDFANKDT